MELLDKSSRRLKMEYKDENDFKRTAKALFDSGIDNGTIKYWIENENVNRYYLF